jgi:pimeloyl-ACP methyl ester carboxylesterase
MTYGQPLGSGARTLLFLHGFPEGSYTWFPVLATTVLDEYTIVAPDMPGYNKSFSPAALDPTYLVPHIANVMTDLIAFLGGSVDLVAHDWGGGIAWWLASAQLPSIKTLTVLNMAHPLGWQYGVRFVEGQQRASAYVLTFIQPGFSASLTANNCSELLSWFKGSSWFTPSMEAALLRSWETGGEPGSVHAGLGWYRANIKPHCPLNCTTWDCFKQGLSGSFDAMPNNGTVTIPVRVLWGMQDTAFDNDFQLGFMPSKVAPPTNLEISKYPKASHWIAQEMPLVVAMEIGAFLKKH